MEDKSEIKREIEKLHSRRLNSKVVLKSVTLLLVALLIVSSAIALVEYNQIKALQKETTFFNGVNSDAVTYYNEFGVTPIANVNSSFAPPVSMYHALQIGLEADGWNKTSLQGMKVYISLMPWYSLTNSSGPYTSNSTGNFYGSASIDLKPMRTPPSNYSDVYSHGLIYRYVWQIDLQKGAGITIPPWDLMLVDAATGEIVPHGPLY